MPNKIYRAGESEIAWTPGGTNAFGLTSLGSGAGQMGDRVDVFGALGSEASLYELRLVTKWGTAPVVGETLEIYLNTWDEGGGRPDVDFGSTTDTGFTNSDLTRALGPPVILPVVESSTTRAHATSQIIALRSRYVAPVVWNGTADALSGTAGDHELTLQPVPPEIQ